jgi:hypothetical protein
MGFSLPVRRTTDHVETMGMVQKAMPVRGAWGHVHVSRTAQVIPELADAIGITIISPIGTPARRVNLVLKHAMPPADGAADTYRLLAESVLRRGTTYDEIERRLFTRVMSRPRIFRKEHACWASTGAR